MQYLSESKYSGRCGCPFINFLASHIFLSITHVLLIALILSYIYIIITTHSLTIHGHVFSNVTYSLPLTYVYLRGSNPYLVTGFSLMIYLRHTPTQILYPYIQRSSDQFPHFTLVSLMEFYVIRCCQLLLLALLYLLIHTYTNLVNDHSNNDEA